MTGIDPLLEMMNRGEFDLIAIGRALLANPDGVQIAREGAWDRLKPYSKDVLERL